MSKIISYLIIIIFISTACSKKMHSTLPDNTLYKTNNTKNKSKIILSEKERNKIASIVGVSPKKIKNDELYALINDWLSVPYFFGGEDRNGIDCSSITQKVIREIYHTELPRISEEMFMSKKVNRFKKRKNLREGDLVFFRINKKKAISHVGIYLQNNKFFSSNVSAGVEIANLNSSYWSRCYVASGRIIADPSPKQ